MRETAAGEKVGATSFSLQPPAFAFGIQEAIAKHRAQQLPGDIRPDIVGGIVEQHAADHLRAADEVHPQMQKPRADVRHVEGGFRHLMQDIAQPPAIKAAPPGLPSRRTWRLDGYKRARAVMDSSPDHR